MTGTPTDEPAEPEVGRRPVVGALAAGIGLSALGGTIVAAQDDEPGDDGNETDGNQTDDEPDDGIGDDAGQEDETMLAALSGTNRGVFTDASGSVCFTSTDDGVSYDLLLENIEYVTQVEVYEGDANIGDGSAATSLVEFGGQDGPGVGDDSGDDDSDVGDDGGDDGTGVGDDGDDNGTGVGSDDGDDGTGVGDDAGDDGTGAGVSAQQDGPGSGEFEHATHDSPIFESGTVDDSELADGILESPSDYYVNVSTARHSDGELSGQIRGEDTTGGMPGGPDDDGPGDDDGIGNDTDDGDDGIGNDTDGGDGIGNDTDGDDGGIGNDTNGGDDGIGDDGPGGDGGLGNDTNGGDGGIGNDTDGIGNGTD